MGYRARKAELNPYAKKRNKILRLLLAIVSIISIIVISILYINNKEEPLKGRLQVCDFTQEETIELFKEHEFTDKSIIKDHFFYGESLALFSEHYDINKPDPLVGKTLLLTNVCTNENFHYLIDYDVDGQIALENLPIGLYEVFINVDMVKKRVAFDEKFNEEINLVSRDNVHRKVEVIGDSNILDDKQNKNFLDANYLFINVSLLEEKTEDYDIVLDPTYGTNTSGFFDNYGSTFLGMVEADETYAMAIIIKEELEKSGLKVLITRDSKDHIINPYGIDGRLNRAYDSKAKYHIELGFNDQKESGLRVFKSSYASQGLAFNISDYLLKNTNLSMYRENSVVSATRYSGYDGIISIREMGGKALAAASFSDLAKDENSSFALLNPYAQEAIKIEYGSLKNDDDVSKFQVSKEDYALKTAEAIIEYLKLGEVEVNDLSN